MSGCEDEKATFYCGPESRPAHFVPVDFTGVVLYGLKSTRSNLLIAHSFLYPLIE